MRQSWCGCAELESVPPKDSEMESLVSASLHQIRLRPCVKGSCLFLSSFSLSKGQTSRPRSVPSSLLSHIIYGYSSTDGYSKVPGCTVDIRIQGCSPRCQMAPQHRSKQVRVYQSVWDRDRMGEIYEKVHKGVQRSYEVCEILSTKLKRKIRYQGVGKKRTVWHNRCWLDVFFPRCRWEGAGINQCQTGS